MVIHDVYYVLIMTYLHFSQVGKPVLDKLVKGKIHKKLLLQIENGVWGTRVSGCGYRLRIMWV